MVWKLCSLVRRLPSHSCVVKRQITSPLSWTMARNVHKLTPSTSNEVMSKQKEEHDEDETITRTVHKLIPLPSDEVISKQDFEEEDDDDDETARQIDYFIKFASDSMDEMDDVTYHDITNYDKKVFMKVVDMWMDNVGPTKKGHREFVQASLNALDKFHVENDIEVYLKLLDCFPDGPHTGIKRSHRWKAAFMDKFPDHHLGEEIMKTISINKIQPDGRLYEKVIDLFGMYSPVARQARNLLFWNPRLYQFQQFPVYNLQIESMSEVEIAFRGLRQMTGGDVDALYRRIEIEGAEGVSSSNLDAIISCQSRDHRLKLSKHDPSQPIYIQGPNMCYFSHKKICYFVMKSSPPTALVTQTEETVKDDYIKVTSEDWWSKMYKTDYKTGVKLRADGESAYDEENFLPDLEISDDYGDKRTSEVDIVMSGDNRIREGDVYAICTTSLDSVDVEVMRSWVSGLVGDNPNISNCNILLQHSTKPFLMDAPHNDPNDEDEYF